MKRALLIACAGPAFTAVAALRLAAAPIVAPPRVGPGDVTAVSVMPAPGKAELVIDVQGTVRISDFALRDPSRVVLDLVGAHLVAPTIMYDGVEPRRSGTLHAHLDGLFRPWRMVPRLVRG